MAEEAPQPISLPDPPTDGITGLSFLGATTLLASTSWDGSVRIHDIGSEQQLGKDAKLQVSHSHKVGPLLSLACREDDGSGVAASSNASSSSNHVLYTGALDGSVHAFDVASNTLTKVGQHKAPETNDKNSATAAACSSVALLPPLVVTAGWDRHLYVWDVRQDNSAQAAVSVDLPGKAFCMDVDPLHSRVAIGCSGRQTCLVDVRRPDQTVTAELGLQGESSQKHQTRCLRFFPDGQRIAVGSVEGRVAVEWVDGRPLENGQGMPKEYAFKCHRRNDLVFPVNAIEFHPKYGTFATGGGDGTVGELRFCVLHVDVSTDYPCNHFSHFSEIVTWDGFNRKRLTALPAFATSVAALAFNHDGSVLAMASSYTFEEGERDHPRDEIFVRRMLDTDCQPKTKS